MLARRLPKPGGGPEMSDRRLRRSRRGWELARACSLFLLTLSILTSPALAAEPERGLEVYLGYLSINESDAQSAFDDELVYGIRSSYPLRAKPWAIESAVSRYETDTFVGFQVFGQTIGFQVDVELIFLDLSAAWHHDAGKHGQIALFFGPGYLFANADLNVNLGGFGGFGGLGEVDDSQLSSSASEDSFTFHLGAAYKARISERLYLRPDIRGRWIEAGGGDGLDVEASLALGFFLQ